MNVTIMPIVIGAFDTVTKGPGWHGSWRTSGDHPNDSIIENGQNTEKSPGDLRRLTVTQNPVKDHQLAVMWKTNNITRINSNGTLTYRQTTQSRPEDQTL